MPPPYPAERISVEAPFQDSGVDIMGPFQLGPHVKRSIMLFVCLTKRAVPTKVIETQSADSFINCLIHFKARRPGLINLWSDCDTNFKGANMVLKNAIKEWNNKGEQKMESMGVKWVFGPPNALT